MNQNSQAGYARFAPGNDYMSQVRSKSYILAFLDIFIDV